MLQILKNNGLRKRGKKILKVKYSLKNNGNNFYKREEKLCKKKSKKLRTLQNAKMKIRLKWLHGCKKQKFKQKSYIKVMKKYYIKFE